MKARRFGLPAFGTQRQRRAMTIGVIALLACLPALTLWTMASRAPTRITVLSVREAQSDDNAAGLRLRAERRQSGILIVLTGLAPTGRSCNGAPPPRYCAAVDDFPSVAYSQERTATAAVSRLYGDGPAPVGRGTGVYAATRPAPGGGGLVPALIVALVLALGVVFLLAAPLAVPSAGPPPIPPIPPIPPGPPRPRSPEPARPRPAARPPVRDVRQLPAVGEEVVCRSHFRPDGGYVCFGGVLVLWAASAVRAQPGDVLTVVGVDQQTGQLRVDVAASHQPPYAEEIR